MKIIEIFWDDLTAEKQSEILEAIGNNNNFDIAPIAVVEFEESEIDPCDSCTRPLCYGCPYSKGTD